MPLPFRRDLTPFIDEFADRHRGVRRGKMFGLPAVYVGRKLLTCLMEDGVIVRLPADLARREVRERRGEAFSRRGKASGSWVLYRPRDAAAARGLTAVIEAGARHLAERQTEDLTGIALGGRKGRS